MNACMLRTTPFRRMKSASYELQARGPFDAGWNPSCDGRVRRNIVAREILHWRKGHPKWRGRRRAYAAGTAGTARRMLLMGTLIAGDVVMSGSGAGIVRNLRRHHRLIITIIPHADALARCRAMRHRARESDRGGDALYGQRHDQYPQYNEAD